MAGRHAFRGQPLRRPLPRPARQDRENGSLERQRRVADGPSWSGSALKSRPRPVQRALKQHSRYPYSPIRGRPVYDWPGGRRLAVYLGFNIEHFDFGAGLGAALGPKSPEPDVLNYSWRDYGNRVGAWRCLELFDELKLPAAALINTALYDYCPELIEACVKRGDELVRQGQLGEAGERFLLKSCKKIIRQKSRQNISGWLSPWISESAVTPDLLAESGYRYTLNWCHDDQPVKFATRSGKALWSIPYPQELNDIPMIVARQMDAVA